MRIIGLTRIRNEQEIIKDTLDHWGKICTGGIYVYDDASTDKTLQICKDHPAVRGIVEGGEWDTDRERAEHENRQAVLERAQRTALPDDWFVYFDADEFFADPSQEIPGLLFDQGVKAIACRLYDVYITPQDVNSPYHQRTQVGPEFRTIVMFFRNDPALGYDKPDQRIVNLPPDNRGIARAGLIKHYGKGFSVEHWEATCDYYINHFPKYAAKWRARKGKAVKEDYRSDFGNPLISFIDVMAGIEMGIPLEQQVYGRN